jgi:hypothetical protein
MKQLIREGRAGPQYGRLGGRPRKDRGKIEQRPGETANALIARAAREDAPAILKVLEDAVKAGQLPHHRLQGVKQWLDAERREVEQAERESEELRKAAEFEALASMDRDQLLAHLAERIASNPALADALTAKIEAARESLPAAS